MRKLKANIRTIFTCDFIRLITCLFFSVSLFCCQENQQGTQSEEINVSNELITDWNNLTYQIAYEHDQFYSFIGVRTLSMVHLAMHDALNSIDRRYEPYLYDQLNAHADPVAASSQAAYQILVDAYPNREDTISLLLNKWMGSVEEDSQKQKGVELGNEIAFQMIQVREGDGHHKQGDYAPMSKPGDYQYTPGWDGWVLKPDFEYAKPFALDTVTQFRSPPAPDLSSEEYADSYNEVKMFGSKDSSVRMEDQTHYAHWWAEFAEHGWNRLGRIVTKSEDLSAWEAARMFALINVDIYDIYLASLESKYYYDTWRPYTAIREAENDQNPLTDPQNDWEPEMMTPPWPEYPSAHAAVAAGGAEMVSHVLGTADVSFSMESVTAMPESKSRSFDNLFEAANECAESRIMNGYHFRFATDEGLKQGRQVAEYIHSNFLGPVE